MLSFIAGTIETVSTEKIIVQCGPYGLECKTPYNSTFTKDEPVKLYTSLIWSQDQGPSLVGFKTTEEKQVFTLLISCSGIGPKMGLSIISSLGIHVIISAIIEQSAHTLSQAKGLGTKKAEKIILELKNKIKDLPQISQSNTRLTDGIQALKTFGYSDTDINEFIKQMKSEESQIVSTEIIIRKALEFFQR